MNLFCASNLVTTMLLPRFHYLSLYFTLVKNVPECNNYTKLFHTWRIVNRNINKLFGTCGRNLKVIESNSTWYRFDEARILEHVCPNTNSIDCGVKYPGFFIQTHPSFEDGVKQMSIHYYRYTCFDAYGAAFVRNCANFYVYKFSYLPNWDCDFGICTQSSE